MSLGTRIDPILSLNPSELFDDDAEYRHLCRLFEKQFGEGIFGPSKRTVTFASKRAARRLQHLNPFRKTGYTEVYQNKSGIKITMDVQQFKVGELAIKVVDQCLVIEGKHKDRKDYHGFISRSFTRKFFLPKGADPTTLSAKLSLDGVLTVTAVSKELPAPKVRSIDICCTRKRALAINATPNRVPALPAGKPARGPAAKKPFKRVNKAGRPNQQRSGPPKPQGSGNNKPLPQRSGKPKQAGGNRPQPPKQTASPPQPPKQSGNAQ